MPQILFREGWPVGYDAADIPVEQGPDQVGQKGEVEKTDADKHN